MSKCLDREIDKVELQKSADGKVWLLYEEGRNVINERELETGELAVDESVVKLIQADPQYSMKSGGDVNKADAEEYLKMRVKAFGTAKLKKDLGLE